MSSNKDKKNQVWTTEYSVSPQYLTKLVKIFEKNDLAFEVIEPVDGETNFRLTGSKRDLTSFYLGAGYSKKDIEEMVVACD
jgi:hypothetical protein